MATYFTKFLIFVASLMCFSFSFSQENFETLGESALAVNHKANDFYSYNFSVKNRYYLYQDEAFNFEIRQLDFVHFSTYKIDFNHSVSFGVQYRFRENFDGGSNELRLTQQYNYTKQKFALRFGHRFRFEQRILENITILRSRYRFALDFPLNGEKLDVGESYLVTSMEAFLSVNKTMKPEFDHRTTAQIGWLFHKNFKFQTGLEYRFEAFNLNTKHKLFILTSAVLKL